MTGVDNLFTTSSSARQSALWIFGLLHANAAKDRFYRPPSLLGYQTSGTTLSIVNAFTLGEKQWPEAQHQRMCSRIEKRFRVGPKNATASLLACGGRVVPTMSG